MNYHPRLHDHHHHHLVGWSGSRRIQSHCPLWCSTFSYQWDHLNHRELFWDPDTWKHVLRSTTSQGSKHTPFFYVENIDTKQTTRFWKDSQNEFFWIFGWFNASILKWSSGKRMGFSILDSHCWTGRSRSEKLPPGWFHAFPKLLDDLKKTMHPTIQQTNNDLSHQPVMMILPSCKAMGVYVTHEDQCSTWRIGWKSWFSLSICALFWGLGVRIARRIP